MLIYDVLHKETIYNSVISDLRNYGVKYRFKKNMFKTERSEGMKQISKKVYKTSLLYQPLDVVNLSSGGIVHVPVFVSQATTFLEKYVTQEGLFRKAGSQLRQKELISHLDNGGTLGEKHYAIDVANCLKTFFRNLPEPLIPYAYHDLFVHCVVLKSCHVQALLLACILLPPHHLNTLAYFMEFLKKVSLFEKQNKMSIDNIAKVVGPNVMPLHETSMSSVQMRLELHLLVIKILIENAESIGILPDHITQAVSVQTIGSTDNELDVSDQLHSKLRKKKHRNGSLTRMFNGLKKIVSKNAMFEDGSTCDSQKLPENSDPLHTANINSTKKRKVDCSNPSTKKKKIVDKVDKSRRIRLSLDRFVPKKSKVVDENASCTKACRTYSDVSLDLKLITKDSDVSNELHREYNDIFVDADINLSDDSDEQVLLTKENDTNSSNEHTQLSSSSEEIKIFDKYDQERVYPKRRVTVNNFETFKCSRVRVTSTDNQSEEYVTIPKSEYEEIKNRVSAIECRLSQEFAYVNKENGDENDDLLPHSVKKVQTAYEKTLEEASIGSTVTTDYLAKKLSKELKIRRSAEHKIIRSPSARKIGSLRRRSQERVMNKRVRRSASWHISHGSNLHLQFNQEPNNASSHAEEPLSINYRKDGFCLRPISTSVWEEEKNNVISNTYDEFNNSNLHTKKLTQNSIRPIKSRIHLVRRVSSFHGNEHANGNMYSTDKVEKLKKTNSQQNIILNNTAIANLAPKSDYWKRSTTPWKDAEGYFKSTNQMHRSITQTGRASIAKLRTQNAGMVLAKAKLFDECKTKVQSNSQDIHGAKDNHCTNNKKQNCERTELSRKPSKNIKNKHQLKVVKRSPSVTMEIERTKGDIEISYYVPKDSTACSAVVNQKENVPTKSSPLVKKIPMNTILNEQRLNMYKTDNNALCRTPNIKKPLIVKTPKSAKTLTRKPIVDSRRTPLKAVTQLGTSKYQSPKSILKTTKNISRCT